MSKKAFTLIELLVVILLIGILFSISVPMFSGITRGTEMNGAVRALSATLSLVRQWSITHKETASVFMETNIFFAFRGDASGTVSGSEIKNGHVNATGKVVRYASGSMQDGTLVYSYIVCKGASDPRIGNQPYTVFDNLSDPVTFDGIRLRVNSIYASGQEVNNVKAIVFKPTGGLEASANYTIEVADIKKPDTVVKTIEINWLTGSVRVK